MEVPVGEELIGRVVNPLGQPIDGQGPINATKTRPVKRKQLVLWIVNQLMNLYKLVSKQLTR